MVYTIEVKMHVVVTVERDAGSLEDAITLGKEMKARDFMKSDVELVDGDLRVVGIQEDWGELDV